MSEPYYGEAVVLCQDQIAGGIFSLRLGCGEIARRAAAGQFVNLYCRDSGRLLPRPISICRIFPEEGSVRLVYRVMGKGTEEFAGLLPGDVVTVMGPLGNGFPPEALDSEKCALILGGGIGIPPMLELAAAWPGKKNLVLGFRDSETFLLKEFEEQGKVFLATEDGSLGTKGNVLDAARENGLPADVIFACGPRPMLRAVAVFARERGIPAWISMEERMACGIGACLACVCRTARRDAHSQVENARVCVEGPVFAAEDVIL